MVDVRGCRAGPHDLLGVYFVYPIWVVVLVFLLTLLLSTIMSAPVNYLARRRVPRVWGTLAVFMALFLGLQLVGLVIAPRGPDPTTDRGFPGGPGRGSGSRRLAGTNLGSRPRGTTARGEVGRGGAGLGLQTLGGNGRQRGLQRREHTLSRGRGLLDQHLHGAATRAPGQWIRCPSPGRATAAGPGDIEEDVPERPEVVASPLLLGKTNALNPSSSVSMSVTNHGVSK